MRYWQTVTDRSQPLAWVWDDDADAAALTISNRLTGAVTSQAVWRATGAERGSCLVPAPPQADEALIVATLVQTSQGTAISRASAELAFVPGVLSQGSGSAVAAPPVTIRTKASSEWKRVRSPRLSSFDAKWWHATGPSGYEVIWKVPTGPHRVERAFEDVGAVDETVLKFGTTGLLLSFK